jgi:N-acetylmuramoyl-L-alanine amidase
LAGTWIALAEWAQANGLAVPVKEPGATNLSFVMRGWQDRLVIRAGNHAVRWNGAECWLGYAPRFQAGQLQVHTLDLEKTIRPLLSGPPALDSKVVVIDPGHGGDNPGTRSAAGPYWEKTFTLDWALRVRDLLTAAGWQVVLTRTNDVNVSSSNRVALADQTQASLFVSLHFNSAPQNAAEAGLETYCLTPAGLPSSLTRGFGDDVRRQHRNNGFDDQNLAWAIRLHRALLQHTGLQDRGVRRARFMTVLQGQHRPAVLLEAGYLSHPAEARKIASPAFRQKLAEAVVHALEPGYLDVLGSR